VRVCIYREKKESALENTHIYICNYEPSNNRSRESSLMISRQTLQLLLSDPLSFFPLSLLRLTSYIDVYKVTIKLTRLYIYIYIYIYICIQSDESSLKNGFIAGKSRRRWTDLPSFLRTRDPNDCMLNLFLKCAERAPKGSANILHSFDALEQEVFDALLLYVFPSLAS